MDTNGHRLDGQVVATVDVDRTDHEYRAWLNEAVRKVQEIGREHV